MIRSLLMVAAVAALLGIGAAQRWGRGLGGGIAVLVMVIAGMVLVLRRNQKDLRELDLAQADDEGDDVGRRKPW